MVFQIIKLFIPTINKKDYEGFWKFAFYSIILLFILWIIYDYKDTILDYVLWFIILIFWFISIIFSSIISITWLLIIIIITLILIYMRVNK
jgi:hypothetical protein